MNREELTRIVKEKTENKKHRGELDWYAYRSVVNGDRNYGFHYLLKYLNEREVDLFVVDTITLDTFPVKSEEDLHNIIKFILERYGKTYGWLQKTLGISYVAPNPNRKPISISVDVMLRVLEAIHCRLILEHQP